MTTLTHWHIGNKLYPVNIQTTDQKVIVDWPFQPGFRNLIDEVKSCFNNVNYDKNQKNWSFNNDARAQYQLSLLNRTGINPYRATNSVSITPLEQDRPYQIAAIEHILSLKRCIVAAKMGFGKCYITGRAADLVGFASLWIVCPNNVKLAWETEWNKFNFSTPIDLLFHYEQAQEVAKECKGFPQALIIDEGSYVKNPNSIRSHYIRYLADGTRAQWGDDAYIIILDGTPAPLNPTDWHNKTEIIHPGYLREASPTRLGHRLGEWEKVDGPYGSYYKFIKWYDHEIEALRRRLEPMVFFWQGEEQRTYIEHPIEPSDETTEALQVLDFAESAIEKLTLAREISDGFIYQMEYGDEDNPKIKRNSVYTEDNRKLKWLKEFINYLLDNGETRIIIYSAFQASTDIIKTTLPHVMTCDGRGWTWKNSPRKGQEMYHLFNSSYKYPIILVGHPKSMGEGLTLPANHIIFYSNDYDSKAREQAEARTRNPSVTIHDLLHLPSDEEVIKNLKNKRNLQSITVGEIDQWFKSSSTPS